MIALVLATLCQAASAEVDGLRAAERALVIHARTAPTTRYIEGRLIDASNARPVAGAMVEGWTENFDMPAVLVDSTSSGRDETFRLRAQSRDFEVEKVRLLSATHRSTTIAASDAYEEVYLLPCAEFVALRVLDFDDHPVAGATVRTHQTCSHAPAAVEARSNADGFVATADFPPLEDHPELQFSANGFMSMRAEDLTALAGASSSATVWLPRIAPLRLTVLDAGGQPAVGVRAVLGAAPDWHAQLSEAGGRVDFTSPFGERRFVVDLRTRDDDEFLIGAWRPAQAAIVVRRGGSKFEPADGVGAARLVLDVRDADPDVPLYAFHDQGWCAEQPGEHDFPPGHVRVLYGAPFSGWREQVVDIELRARERRSLELRAQAEPLLRLQLPFETAWTVDVQAGSDSTRIECGTGWSVAVPPGVELVVMARNDMEVRRARCAGLERDGELSLAGEECVVQRMAGASEQVELRFVCDPEWHARGLVRFAGSNIELEDDEQGVLALRLPRGTPYEAWFGAPGRVRSCIVGQAATERDWPVQLSARSTILLRGNVRQAHAAGADFERGDDSSFALAELAPGPLDVRVQRNDGSALELQLDLQPGDTRELTVH